MTAALALLAALLSPGVGEADAPSALDAALGQTVADGLILQSDTDWHRGDYGRAARALLLSIEFDPGNVDAWSGASWLLWSWSAKETAIRVLDEMVRALPEDVAALDEAGELVRLQGDRERALCWLREAFRLAPDDEITCIRLGALLRGFERWDEAATVYRSLLEHHPGHPSALRFLERYERTGQMTPDVRPEAPPAVPPGESSPPEPARPRPGGPSRRSVT